MCQSVHVLHLRQEDAAKIYCPNAENNFDKQHTGGPLLQILVSLMVDIPASAGSNERVYERLCWENLSRQLDREKETATHVGDHLITRFT